MEITPDSSNTSYTIRRCSSTSITVNEIEYTKSLILSANQLIPDWRPQHLNDITLDDLTPILELKPQVVLLGVGEKHIFPSQALLKPFYQQHIGVEIMTTQAACHTFNLLVAEGRPVVVALIIEKSS